MLEIVAKCLAAYLLGGVMGGDLIGRLRGGVDLRREGSGNVGATNALRTRGWKFALAVLLIDAGKGVAAALWIPALPWPAGATATAGLGYGCGLAAALGHCYPLTACLRGGKGVATLAGVFGALLPAALVWMLGAFVLVILLSGYVALASIGGALVAVCCTAVRYGFAGAPFALSLAMAALLIFKHGENLARLRDGSEHRFERARLLGRSFERLADRWRGR